MQSCVPDLVSPLCGTCVQAGSESVNELEASLAQLNEEMEKRRVAIEKARAQAATARVALEKESNQAEKVLDRRRVALRRKEECTLKLREMGTLPEAEIEDVKGVLG